jgi:hypothetical protein
MLGRWAIAAAAPRIEQRPKHALEERMKPRGEAFGRVRVVATRLHPVLRKPRCDDECDRERQEHAHARVDRYGTHVRTHQAADERHGQQRGDDGQCGKDRRPADLVDRARNDFGERLVGRKRVVLAASARREQATKISQLLSRFA